MYKGRQKQMYLLMLVLVGVLSFGGGVLAAGGNVWDRLTGLWQVSDTEWAKSAGYFPRQVQADQAITQAEFLRAVMELYGEKQTGLQVPKGAENHWAADIYALAQGKGVIDCTCQIKPDEFITVEEAARFVMLGVNRKAEQPLLDLETAQAWVAPKKADDPVTYQDAATLIRKMDDLYHKHGLVVEGDEG